MTAPRIPLRVIRAMEGRPTLTLCLMLKSGRMGRGGGGPVRLVVGFGVSGRGGTWREAAEAWSRGARALNEVPVQGNLFEVLE